MLKSRILLIKQVGVYLKFSVDVLFSAHSQKLAQKTLFQGGRGRSEEGGGITSFDVTSDPPGSGTSGKSLQLTIGKIIGAEIIKHKIMSLILVHIPFYRYCNLICKKVNRLQK